MESTIFVKVAAMMDVLTRVDELKYFFFVL
jgi:hypothetical protein